MMMKLKELIFGYSEKNHDSTGASYIGSSQAWLPVKNVVGGVVITKDNRYIKILEILPVNIYLKSAADRQNIIASYAAYLKIAQDSLQI